MKGYPIDCGYMGYIPSKGKYCLFVTEEEYKIMYLIDIGEADETEPLFSFASITRSFMKTMNYIFKGGT